MVRGRGWGLWLWCWSLPVAAAGDFPPITNHAAQARSFALPALGETRVLHAGESRAHAVFDLSNEFEFVGFTVPAQNCTQSECQRLDAETYRVAFRYRAALAPGWDWSIELPVLAQDGGFMDGGIEDWHAWLGLPNGGREFRPRHRYDYYYERDGEVLLNVRDPSTGAGDATLGIGRRLGADTALRAQLKLPTGDGDRLTGGNPGAAVWLDVGFAPAPRWRGYVSGGVSVNDRGEVLPKQQNRIVAVGGLGLGFAASENISLHAQFYAHGRLYDGSRLRAMRRNGAVLGLGLRYRAAPDLTFDLTLLEDTNVNVSPDFGLQMALSWSP